MSSQISTQYPLQYSLVKQVLCKKMQKNEFLITVQEAWTQSFEPALCTQTKRRKKLQKVEFLTCWAFLLFLAVVVGAANNVVLLGTTEEGGFDLRLLSYGHTAASLYIEMSLLTRAIAYAIDFTNARVKLGKLPSWLVLHHLGVYALHVVTAFYFSQSYSKTILYLLSLQSTHNTWTKNYSLILYWGNVLLGVVTTVYFAVMNIIEDEVSLSFGACICCVVAMITCFAGIGLLVVDCCSVQKKLHVGSEYTIQIGIYQRW
jgi:hypothetical protein